MSDSRKLEKERSDVVLSAVSADDLAPFGAKSSAGTVLTQCTFITYMGLALKGLINNLYLTHWGRAKCFADNIFKYIFLNKNVWIWLKISLKFAPKVWINNIQKLVQIMAWRQPGAKPLSEPMMVSLMKHIYVTRPQWVI